ncbi:peptide chain release factor N(5)-glutamine methyltransferase [Mucilaginibacter auburnensis]|uniref:Release factor glutamine methyltransferase n=1 Tax=Mucilaginibacter auburnensis TaxID=1457233 RepID=A0A2H9VV42_9SPHI|nr:peptide chain release factor N(5)-glutamine methyltransferase [Mucilaginibacter auburnensis]PJJ84686.1 release factor glutamine methyltransferase [Mucilaginibacter auburnensis]
MQTVKDVFVSYSAQLSDLYDKQEADAITLTALREITGRSSAYIKAFPDDDITPEEQTRLSDILKELAKGQPLQYVLGHTEFYGLPFKVNPAVLIPRPETEELVDWVLKSDLSVDSPNILDIGTGSGCIAISLKKILANAKVWAMDISNEALQTAKANAELNEVEVNFIETDVLQQSTLNLLPFTFNLIISNPPYVTPFDKTQMHTNVTDFEPHTALFVPQHDPLLFYKAIADLALKKLTKGGLLFFEINESYGNETVDMLKNKGFEKIELRKDLSGRDRMIKAVL